MSDTSKSEKYMTSHPNVKKLLSCRELIPHPVVSTTYHEQAAAKGHRRANDAARHVGIFAWKMNFSKTTREVYKVF